MPRTKKTIKEIFVIRCIACLGIVLLHSIASSLLKFNDLSTSSSNILMSAFMLLLFGTPVFVFISEFLLSKSYPVKLPTGFFKKRTKFLFFPYISMAIIYGFIDATSLESKTIIIKILRNIFLGDFTAYFILIIFQFYVVHMIFQKFLYKWSPRKGLSISFLINSVYLGFFNYVPAFDFIPYSKYLWYKSSWMFFFAWIFYFALGYYAGKNYSYLTQLVNKYRIYLGLGVFIFGFLVVWLNLPHVISSKRVDILVYTSFLVLLLFYLSSKIKNVPPFIYVISNYSFSIFLLHKIFIHYLERLPINNLVLYIAVVFILSLTLSIMSSYLINKIPFGKYIVGNIARFKPVSTTKVQRKQAS